MTKQTEIVYGLHSVRHVIETSAGDILEVWIQDSKKNTAAADKICSLTEAAGIPVQYAARETLRKLTGVSSHQGMVLRRRCSETKQSVDLGSLLARSDKEHGLWLILDGIQDPHNLGACLRTADAAGVNGVIIPKDRAVAVNATVRKVASGAAESVPVIQVTNLSRSLALMQKAGIWIFGMTDEAETSLYEMDLRISVGLVLGSEGKGLRQNTRKYCDQLVNLPMHGSVESLNVSVAAGICLYEAIRQRGN